MSELKNWKETSCACERCVSMCEYRPCWPTPAESKAIIDAGFGERLMDDYWVAEEDIHIISPAVVGYENKPAPFIPTGRCTFLKNGLCELHDKGLKPLEGRLSPCPTKEPDVDADGLHKAVADTWDGDEGRSVVEYWRNGDWAQGGESA